MTDFELIPDGESFNPISARREPKLRGRINEGALTTTSADKGGSSIDPDVAAVVLFMVIVGAVFIAAYWLVKYTIEGARWCWRKAQAHKAAKPKPVASIVPAAALPSIPESQLRAEAEAEWDARLLAGVESP